MDYIVNNFESIANIYVSACIEIFLLLVAVLYAFWLMPFMEKKIAAYLGALIYGILTVVNNHVETSRSVSMLIALGIIAISFFTVWLFDGRRNPIQKILLCVIFRLISWLSLEVFTEVGFYERDLLFKFDWYSSNVKAIVIEFLIWNPISYIMPLALLYAVIRILHKVYRHKRVELTWQELIILLTPVFPILLVKPIMSSYFLLWMDGIANGSIKENIPANPFRILFSLLAFFPVIIVIALYQRLKEKQEEAFARESLENQLDDTHRYTAHIDELYEKMRAMRHDMGNHLTVIEGLAESGKNRELSEYIGEFRNRFSEIQPVVATGNAVTDIVLSEISDECKKDGIYFESRFMFPGGLDINPFDMSVVLTNALRNAIEASKCVPDAKIMIKSVTREHTFIINIKNKTDKRVKMNEDGLVDSTKKDTGHGYGLKNIRSIAGKYKGDIEIRQEEIDGELFFILNVMMMG